MLDNKKANATKNAFDHLLGKKEEATIETIETKNKIDNIDSDTENINNELSETYINIRFPKKEKEILSKYLKKTKGLKLSSGVRQILFEYIQKLEIK